MILFSFNNNSLQLIVKQIAFFGYLDILKDAINTHKLWSNKFINYNSTQNLKQKILS